jgi:hypothetical protein
MMQSFMISGSLTQDMEPEGNPSGSDAMPFPGKDAVTTVYDGQPLRGGVACPTRAPGPQLTAVGNLGTEGCKGTSFFLSLYIYILYVKVYMTACPNERKK